MAAAQIPDPPVGNPIPGGLIAGTKVEYTIKRFPNVVFVGTIVKNGAVPQDGPQGTRIARTPNGSNQQDHLDGHDRRGFYFVQHQVGVKLFAAIRQKGPPAARIPGVARSTLPLTIDPITFIALVENGTVVAPPVVPGGAAVSAPLLVPSGAGAGAAPLAPGGGVAGAAPLEPGGGVAGAAPLEPGGGVAGAAPLEPGGAGAGAALPPLIGLGAVPSRLKPTVPEFKPGGTGGYYEKYLKYKAKYLSLKNQM